MSLPTLLLVDDSEAVLAYEQQALGGLYRLVTARSGVEALRRLADTRPAAVLLDLSMPEMDGDEVLRRMKADPALAGIPVVVVSSEQARGEACLALGAWAFLPKPVQAEQLRKVVDEALASVQRAARAGSLAVIPVGVGERWVALPLDAVHLVTMSPAARPLTAGPSYLDEVIDLHGAAVAVLDMARPLRVAHAVPPVDRKLVVVRSGEGLLGLTVDGVRDPQECPAEDVTWRERLGGEDRRLLEGAVLATVRTAGGLLPVLDPALLVSRGRLRALHGLLARLEPAAPGEAR